MLSSKRAWKILLVTAAGSAAPAEAHWQYTRWGMMPEQVIAASKGMASRSDPTTDAALPIGVKEAVGIYNADGRAMKASFWFKSGKLNQVNLSSDNDDACLALNRDLIGVYDQPTSRSRGMIETSVWLDKERGNRVQFSSWGTGGCNIIYAPLPTAQGTGL